ncbi:Ligand-binding SRPBCC domain-containing protein [Zobellia uliginosa]|uniref:Ligand-binding SRPBCC domain-containing protein n=2 Tax=Zobellia uliginosa TaxID=143224 RepID=A0ABY1KP95_9FLAO|nr:Ligand-binding SRPBCC domain-containing protein [Zobellia uliginosa]
MYKIKANIPSSLFHLKSRSPVPASYTDDVILFINKANLLNKIHLYLLMKLYQLHAKQSLPIRPEAAWAFLADPKNLKIITPEHMGFEILSGDDRPMFSGQIIQYTVSPFKGYTTKWVTEITHVQEGKYFVDEQRFGPYTLWHHKHFIKAVEGGVEMEDIIDYKIPFGIFGRLAHPILIKRQLQQIFSYREKKLIELFGTLENGSRELHFRSF